MEAWHAEAAITETLQVRKISKPTNFYCRLKYEHLRDWIGGGCGSRLAQRIFRRNSIARGRRWLFHRGAVFPKGLASPRNA